MNPAPSIIVFTVLSGVGFGLVTLAGVLDVAGGSRVTTPALIAACATGIALTTAGLLSSTRHLANPRNAWRAFFRFRSSWLSREVVSSILFYPFALSFTVGLWLHGAQRGLEVEFVGAVAALLAVATVFCTGMIYASLRTIRQWHTSLVPVNYVLLSLASGALALLAAASLLESYADPELIALCLTLLMTAALGKAVYYYWIGSPEGPTINTATGVTRGHVRLLESGQSSANFSNREFSYRAPAGGLRRIRLAVHVLGFGLPLLLVYAWRHDLAIGALAALLSSLAGITLERWLFFAEARHVVNLFYGAQQC